MKIDNIKNSDLEALSNYSKNNYDYINIAVSYTHLKNINNFTCYSFNCKFYLLK